MEWDSEEGLLGSQDNFDEQGERVPHLSSKEEPEEPDEYEDDEASITSF